MLRPFIIGAVLLLSACASTPDRPFSLIKPSEGWVQMKAPPPDSETIVEAALAHLDHVDGVMMGRAAYQEPWRLLDVDRLVFGEAPRFASAKETAAALVPYIEREAGSGTRLHSITRHLHGLFRATPGARTYRRTLAAASTSDAGAGLLLAALAHVRDENRQMIAA